jgi:hypothetical protein
MEFPDFPRTMSAYMRLQIRSSPGLKVEIGMVKNPERPPSSVLLWIVMIPLAAVMVAALVYFMVTTVIPVIGEVWEALF